MLYTQSADRATLQKLISLTHALSAELSLPRLYDQIIAAAQDFTQADGGTLYILQGSGQDQQLHFEVVHNNTLGIHAGGQSATSPNIAPIPLWLDDGSANHNNVCAHVWHEKQLVNIADVYTVQDFDFSGAQAFDQKMSYRTQSLLTIPLQNHIGDIIGVLQLINAHDPIDGKTTNFAQDKEPLIMALASTAAVTLDKQQLIQGHKDLLNAFIKAIAKAIDAKSQHTSAHCQRIPIIMELFAQAACDSTRPEFSEFNLDEDQWYELKVAAWLHDCGKLSTPDSILDKSTKLHALSDRIETVKTRFAALISQIKNNEIKTQLPANLNKSQQIELLQDDCDFIIQANKGAEFMRLADQQRVREIAQYQWLDYQGQTQNMLTDDEVAMLCIERGTLSVDERAQINRHIDVTIEMLESLPFPNNLAKVPEYAGGHHEKIDGSGFPRGLTGEQMSIPAKMMAIADIFEALTARDRPYKPPMPLSQALSILRNMRDKNQIDAELFQLFVESRIWESYARENLLPEQLDINDISEFL